MNTATSNATPAQLTLLDAMKDPVIFGPWFESKTWRAWRVFFRALFGLKMGPRSLEIYPKHTGRTVPPEQPSKEAWLVVGRRGVRADVRHWSPSFWLASESTAHSWLPENAEP